MGIILGLCLYVLSLNDPKEQQLKIISPGYTATYVSLTDVLMVTINP